MDVYYLTSRFKLFVILQGLIIIVIQTGILVYSARDIMCCAVSFLVLGGAYFFRGIFVLNMDYIVLNKTGIEYHRKNSTLKVLWEDMESISPRWFLTGRHDSIVADSAKVTTYRHDSSPFGSLISAGEYKPKHVFIPISCFSDNWHDSELGQQIKRRAPNLFNNN
ncbi:MAG: hypothetical protein ACOYZ6_09525 [Chloroflexota bacterium]